MAAESILTIELHPAYFAFAVKEPDTSVFQSVVLDHNERNITPVIDVDALSEWLKQYQTVWNRTYQKICISLHGYPVTVAPDEEAAEDFLVTLFGIDEQQYHIARAEFDRDFIWVLGIPKAIKSLLDNYFLGAMLVPGAHGICKQLLHSNQDSHSLNLHITPKEACFFFIQQNRPLYYNVFRYTDEEDLLYYILLVYKMLDLDPESFPISLTGLIEADSNLYKMLYQYIRNIYIAELPVPVAEDSYDSLIIQPNYLANLVFSAN